MRVNANPVVRFAELLFRFELRILTKDYTIL